MIYFNRGRSPQLKAHGYRGPFSIGVMLMLAMYYPALLIAGGGGHRIL